MDCDPELALAFDQLRLNAKERSSLIIDGGIQTMAVLADCELEDLVDLGIRKPLARSLLKRAHAKISGGLLSSSGGSELLESSMNSITSSDVSSRVHDPERKEVVVDASFPQFHGLVVEKFVVKSGQASVYQGRHVGLSMKVAVKVMHAQDALSESSYRTEVESLLRLRHKNKYIGSDICLRKSSAMHRN